MLKNFVYLNLCLPIISSVRTTHFRSSMDLLGAGTTPLANILHGFTSIRGDSFFGVLILEMARFSLLSDCILKTKGEIIQYSKCSNILNASSLNIRPRLLLKMKINFS